MLKTWYTIHMLSLVDGVLSELVQSGVEGRALEAVHSLDVGKVSPAHVGRRTWGASHGPGFLHLLVITSHAMCGTHLVTL